MVGLTLYGREHCHLCDEMKQSVGRYDQVRQLSVTVVDVDRDTALQQRFGHLVPVLMDGETEICHFHFDANALDAHLRKMR